MSAKSFEYGIASDFNGAVGNQANSSCPAGYTCNRNIRTDGGNAWRAAIGCASGLCGYDNAFYVTAGHDESSTWQEFGEMLWTDREQVPAKFGPPGAEDGPVLNSAGNPIPNWAPTRYVPWTSWRRGREPLAERGRRHLDAGRELGPERVRARVQPSPRARRTTTTTRSPTTSGPAPATGR